MAILTVFADTVGNGACKSCQAPIVWVEIATSGKKHPLNGRAKDLTPVRTSHEGGRTLWEIDTTINTSHFATCPNATDWRKRK